MKRFQYIGAALILLASSVMAESYRPKERWRGFNLTGMMVQRASTGYFSEQDFALINELGFNFVRIPLDYRYWVQEGEWRKIDADALKPLDQALEWAGRHHLHVMLSLHRAPGLATIDPPEEQDLFKDQEALQVCIMHWSYLAERYKLIPPAKLSFGLLNEPSDKVLASNYVRVVSELVKAVRPHNPQRLMIADGLQWGRKVVPELFGFDVGVGTRGYEPHDLSHYRVAWAGNPTRLPSWPPSGAVTPLLGPQKAPLNLPLVLRNIPACWFIIKPGMISGDVDLQVMVNDDYLKVYPLHAGKGSGWSDVKDIPEWGLTQGKYNRTVEFEIKRDNSRVTLAVAAGDWAELEQIYLQTEDFQQAVLSFENVWGKTNAVITFNGFDAYQTFESDLVKGGLSFLRDHLTSPWEAARKSGKFVFTCEFGAYKHTPHDVTLKWMEDYLKIWKMADIGWALRDFRGPYGIIDSGRDDVKYENFRGYKLDRQMLELLRKY